MNVFGLVVAAVNILWIASLVGMTVKLVRARSPDDHQEAYRMMTAVIVAGVIMFVAPSAMQWLTGFQKYGGRYCSKDPAASGVDKDDVCLPKDMSSIFDKLINGLRALGGVVLIVGLIWSGIKLLVVPPSRRSSPGGGHCSAAPPAKAAPA